MKYFALFFTIFWLLHRAPLRAASPPAENPASPASQDAMDSADENNLVPQIFLRVGEKYPLEGVSGENLKAVPQSIASVHTTPSGPLLLAHAPGQARLYLDEDPNDSILVNVRGEHLPARPSNNAKIDLFLKNIQGTTLKKVGEKSILEGQILHRSSYRNLLILLKQKPAFTVLATAPTALRQSFALQAKQLLLKNGLDEVDVIFGGNRFFLEGRVSTPVQVDQAYETAASVIPNIENHLRVPLRIDPSISIRVFILELSRSAHEVLGLRWPGMVNEAVVASPKNLLFGPQWTGQLLHLAKSGEAKILAEPMLAVKSGSSAELNAGGEIPLRVTGKYENKIIWKHYGMKLRIQIAGISGSVIRTKIETSMSSLDDATAIDGIPGVRKNSLQTEIDAEENKPILLTGLFHSTQAKDVEKIPLLGDIPLLGEIFKSRRFQNRESELLVAFLPRFGTDRFSLPAASERGLHFDFKWRITD